MPGLAKREADQHCECVGAPPRESGGGTLCFNGAAAHAARRRRAAVCVCGASWPAPCRLMTSGGTELLEVVQVYGVGQDLLKAQGPLALQTLLGDGRRHPAGRRRHDAKWRPRRAWALASLFALGGVHVVRTRFRKVAESGFGGATICAVCWYRSDRTEFVVVCVPYSATVLRGTTTTTTIFGLTIYA